MTTDFLELVKRAEKTANVGERLLAEGKAIVYTNGWGDMVKEYPNGDIFLIGKDGELTEYDKAKNAGKSNKKYDSDID